MSRFTIFVGGVHGAGKGHLCHSIRQEVICDYVSASPLLNRDARDITFEDFEANLEKLTFFICHALQSDKSFLVEGHYSLKNRQSGIEKVGMSFFNTIKPDILVVVTGDPAFISQRLQGRDQIVCDITLIDSHQKMEVEHARYISKQLGIPLFIIDSQDNICIKKSINAIRKIMTKYTRDNIFSQMLKTVIIRFDYSGGTNLLGFIDSLKQESFIRAAFGKLNRIDAPQDRYDTSQKGNGPGPLPIIEKQRDIMFRFSDAKYDKGLNVILDITPESVCLSIDCRENYKGSKDYTILICNIISYLKNKDPFISIKRIGVRKIDVQLIAEDDCLEHYFNENFLALQSWRKNNKDRVSYADFFKRNSVNFNVVQYIDRISVVSDKEELLRERAIYDIDAYVNNGDTNILTGEEHSLIDFLNVEMQEKMFELFVSVASERYLDECLQAKRQQNG